MPLDRSIRSAENLLRAEHDRIRCQLRFAEGFAKLFPKKTNAWTRLVRKAEETVAPALAKGNRTTLRKAIREAEETLAPIGKAAKKKTVYCAGHAHMDMNWMWSWPETVSLVVDTVSTVLRLLEEFPDFHFGQSQASIYRIIERFAPHLLPAIRERIEEGRWEVTASHWVENEANCIIGESHARHLLYTRRYMAELFGLEPEAVPVNWAPDTFGHAASLPGVLVRGGVTRMYCYRPGTDGGPRPPAFWWEGPDGSRVAVRFDKYSYNGKIHPDAVLPAFLDYVGETGHDAFLMVYGVGDHGGGPTRRDILWAREMGEWPIWPRLELSGIAPYFAYLEGLGEALPVWKDELNREFTGCYTSQSLLKRANRQSEDRLYDAEVAASLGWALLGKAYPAQALRTCWEDTLFSHFHDILPGSGVHDTRTYSHGLFQEIMARVNTIETETLRLLAGQIDTTLPGLDEEPEEGAGANRSGLGAGVGFLDDLNALTVSEQSGGEGPRPFVIFNAAARPRDEVVTVTVWENNPDTPPGGPGPGMVNALMKQDFSIRTPEGGTIPAQLVDHGLFWTHDYVKLAFPVKDLPGFGYQTYAVVLEKTDPPADPPARTASRFVLENEKLLVEVDPKTGGLRRLVEKGSGLDLAPEGAAPCPLRYALERPHPMSSWAIDEHNEESGLHVKSMERTKDGPYVTEVTAEMELPGTETRFTVRYELRAGDACLRFSLDGTWTPIGTHETGVPSLHFRLPLALEEATGLYEIPFGAIERGRPEVGPITFGPGQNGAIACGDEVPGLRFCHIGGKCGGREAGCLVLNDSKHGYSYVDGVFGLTLIRSSYNPDPIPEVGRHRVSIALRPSVGRMRVAEAVRAADDFVHPPRIVGTPVHGGDLPKAGAFLAVEPEAVSLSALKVAEEGDGLVVRLYETEGKAARAKLTLDKTLGAIEGAEALDLLERPMEGEAVTVKGRVVQASLPAHGIATLRIRTAR